MVATSPAKTPDMRRIEEREGRDIREVMSDAYRRGGNVVKAAQLMGISHGAFSNWVNLMGGTYQADLTFPADTPAGVAS